MGSGINDDEWTAVFVAVSNMSQWVRYFVSVAWALLLEDGDFLLQEDWGLIMHEGS